MVSFGNPRRRVPPLPYYRATNRSEGMEKFDNRGGRLRKGFPSRRFLVFIWRVLFRDFPLWFFPHLLYLRDLVSNVSTSGWIYIGDFGESWGRWEGVEQCARGIQLWKIRSDEESIRGIRGVWFFNFF